ncbi:type II toxin-antitoxin system VapC family toxin [Spirosoma foliorum]|uniref:Ribonuclease VapC n=1 Tax=Spirosoma foliorum TaxID=2710596 RepID=A0A7G5GZ61_9BACT|nr:type II toxin-antitoxin system VapC family toxin [Spirosoma foliorum]QMW04153.1 type II toxin-antitoxin system VapC family toxin [Spirosoma foliorum]
MGTLLDTNILIYMEKGISDTKASLFLREATRERLFISIITEIELLGFPFESETALRSMEALIADSIILPLDKTVANQTIAIRRQRKIKLPDAIIAATALVHGCTLVTRNVSDFVSIDGLLVINPFIL